MAGDYSRTYDGIARGSPLSAADMRAALNLLEKADNKETTVSGSADRYPTVKAIRDTIGLEGEINDLVDDSAVLHKTGDKTETISVAKTFTTMPAIGGKRWWEGKDLSLNYIGREATLYNIYNDAEKPVNKRNIITASSTNTEYPTCSAVTKALNAVKELIKNEIIFYPSDLYTASSTRLSVYWSTRTVRWTIGTITSKNVNNTTILDGGYAMVGHITHCVPPTQDRVITVYTTNNGGAHSGQSAKLTVDVYGRVTLSDVLYCPAHPSIETIYCDGSISWTY
ncbi:hypothetical protein NO2_1360 [Candidatus Termititenax persephonae]|uniref:Uncharacterized protein n=1 Tax=Candidatus Termititenax persephonae TaxID=2218525 RepID=A0A388TI67_9BACT|nr:hypothetical protein NO2_1360 [Candidatus Termititenax persephonae]